MNQPLEFVRPFDPAHITTLLLDADDNLFPSEAPAFDASAEVTTRFLARFGVSAPLSGDELRKKAVGKNFRSTATDLAVLSGVPFEKALADGRPDAVVASDSDVASGRALTADELEQWVRQEREQVTAHLAVTLKPDPEVLEPLQALASRYAMAAVSSSALARLKASFTAAGLDPLDPGGPALQRRRFAAGADQQARPSGLYACRPGARGRSSPGSGRGGLGARCQIGGCGRLPRRRKRHVRAG